MGVAQMDFWTEWTKLAIFRRASYFLIFSAPGLFDICLAIKTYCTKSWGVLGVSGEASSWNSVCEGIADIPVETREIDHPFVTGGTKRDYFLKTLNYMNTKI